MKVNEVLEIFESDYSEEVYDRKARNVMKFFDERTEGFFYNELEDITKIAKYILVDFRRGFVKEMKEPMIALLEKAKLGFKKLKIFDDRLQFDKLPDFLNVFVPILYDFSESDEDWAEIHNNKSLQGPLNEIKLAFIEFLYYFVKEDFDKIKEAEESRENNFQNDKETKKLTNNTELIIETLGPKRKNVRECQKIYQHQNFQDYDSDETNPENQPILENLKIEGTKNFKAIQLSSIPEAQVYFLQHNIHKYELMIFTLEVLNFCVMYRNLVEKFCCQGLLKDIIYLVFDKKDDFRSYLVRLCFEILWNAIESIGRKAIEGIASEDIVFALRELFLDIMKRGYKLEDKCLRNELLILINYILTHPDMIPFLVDVPYKKHFNHPIVQNSKKQQIQSQSNNLPNDVELDDMSFQEILLYFATVDETIFYNVPFRTNNLRAVFGLTTEDLEFKKQILSGILLAIESESANILEICGKSNFIQSLLLYIDPLSNSYAVNRWSSPQLREIQLHCLTIMSSLIAYMKNYFYEKNGIFCMTKFLTNTSSTDIEKKEKCLRAFVNASLFEEGYKQKIAEEGVIDVLIDLIANENENIEIKELCFTIISNLCKGCNKNKKQFRNKGGVDLIINSLKNPNICNSERNALFALAVLDCLWNSTLGNKKSESLFLDNEGFYILMEFIESCDEIHRKMSLTCLCQLVENTKTQPYFDDWNSIKTMRNSTQLLVKIYEDEDEKYNVNYREGVLLDIYRPLNPKKRTYAEQSLHKNEGDDASQPTNDEDETDAMTMASVKRKNLEKKMSVMSMTGTGKLEMVKGFSKLKEALQASEADSDAGAEAYLIRCLRDKTKYFDLRSIIFATLYRTGFDRNHLKPMEKQRLEVIQIYPQLKLGEIWRSICEHLEESVIPTSEDKHWMLTNIEEFEELVLNCVNTQKMISRENKKQQEDDLNRFFDIIRSNKTK